MTRGVISLTGLFLVLASMLARAQAQTNMEGVLVPNRYLFVVETSRAMQRRAEGVVAVAQDLVNSGFRGQLRRGDTLGVWTFNSELATGQFPLEEWSSEARATIAVHLLTFLQGQTYEKQARLEKLWPSLERVLKDSQFITVILISSGEDKLRGTPFDDRINEAWGKWRTQQQQARMPLVTILRASYGQILQWSVTPAPWDPDLPPLPAESQIAQGRPTAPPPVLPAQATSSTPVVATPKRVTAPRTDSGFSEIAAANPAPKPLPPTNVLTAATRPALNAAPPAPTPSGPVASTVPSSTTELKPPAAAVPLASAAVQAQHQVPEATPDKVSSKTVTPPPASVPDGETAAKTAEPRLVPASSQESTGVTPPAVSSSVAANSSAPSEALHPSAPLTPAVASQPVASPGQIVQPPEVQGGKAQGINEVQPANVPTRTGDSPHEPALTQTPHADPLPIRKGEGESSAGHPEDRGPAVQANVRSDNFHPEPFAAATPAISSRSATNQPASVATPASRAENSAKSETVQAAAPQRQAATVEGSAKPDSPVGAQAFPAAGTGHTRGAFDVVLENVIWLGLVIVTSALAGFCFFRWLQGFLGRRGAAVEAPLSEEHSDAEQPGIEAEQPGKLLAGQGTPAESRVPEGAPGVPVRR